jgi:prefoldin subunit 5
MSDTTEIEKKSLEAHVELCAERYNSLDQRLDSLGNNINKVEDCVEDIKNIMAAHVEKHNDRLIAWGVGIIGLLVGAVGWLMATYVFK